MILLTENLFPLKDSIFEGLNYILSFKCQKFIVVELFLPEFLNQFGDNKSRWN